MHLGSARAGEHAAGIVDHAMRGIVTHPAATDRMDGDQLLAERVAPQGIGEILRIDCARGFGHAVVVAPETTLFAGLGPMDRKPVVFECELPTRIVDAHHQIGLRARHGALVCPLRDASRIGLDRLAHCLGIEQARLDLVHAEPREPIGQRLTKEECRRERGGDDPWRDTFLDNQPVGDILGRAHVDHAGNAGPRIGILRDIRSANTNRIERLRSQRIALLFSLQVTVIGEAQRIAIAREIRPQPVGQRQSLLARAEQYLRRPQRARAEDDMVGRDAARALSSPFAIGLDMDAPARSVAFDPQDLDLREDVRPVVRGIGQVVHQRGVLRPDIAA